MSLAQQIEKIGSVKQLELKPAEEFADVPSETLAEWINSGHVAIKMAVRRLAVHVAQVGAFLVAAKKKCQHGEWLDWLAENCSDISQRTAYNYIETYEKLRDANLQLIANLPVTQAYRELGIVKDPVDREIKSETPETLYPPIIYQESYEKFFDRFDNQSIDLLLTDPPFMTDVDDIHEFACWVDLALPKVKPTGRVYICTGAYPDELRAYLNVFYNQEHFKLSNILVWTYRNTLGPQPSMEYKLNWQAIFYLYGKEAPPLNCSLLVEQFAVQDINAPDGRTGIRYHTWQKPGELGERFIRHSTQTNALVVDCFAGTGTFVLAASRLGRRGVGCENSEEMLEIARNRGCVINRVSVSNSRNAI